MTKNITVPQLGESVVEATVGQWHKKEGDPVSVGDILVDLETDKVDVEVGAEVSGVLTKITHESGTDVKIGDVLGEIDEDGTAPAVDDQPKEAEEKPADRETAQKSESKEKEEETAVPESDKSGKITPVAKRFAEEKGVDWTQVKGQGPNERVTRQDVEDYLARQQGQPETEKTADKKEPAPKPAKQTQPAPDAPAQDGREERIKMSRRRRTIAQRLVEAQQTAAMLTTFNDIDMSAVIEIRKRRQDAFVKQFGVKLGFMSFFVKAAIGALKAYPRLNAEIDGDEMVLKHYYDIGMAVGAEEGLVVPVVRDADRKSFAEIEQEIRDLAQKARDNSLALDDLRGGTFTITNGGVFGSMLSTPILNPPQVGILGLHRIEERPIALNGEVVIRPMMYVALSYDHRIVDGSEAVQFLVQIKEYIEDPESLLLAG